MAKFKLIAGQHVAADKKKPVLGPDGKPTGRFETHTYNVGDVVESDIDLVARFGPQRFQALGGQAEKDARRIAQLEAELSTLKAQQGAQTAGGVRTPGDPTPENLANSPAVAPGGQVSTGFQGVPKGEDLAEEAGASQGKSAASEEPDDDLESLTVSDLRELAADEEIDLKGARAKDDVIRSIREARSAK